MIIDNCLILDDYIIHMDFYNDEIKSLTCTPLPAGKKPNYMEIS